MTPRSPRALAGVCAALVVAAGALWGGSALVWLRVAPDGRAPVELTGAAVAPELTGIALVALAGVGGVVATGGALRRLVGVLLVGAAGWAAAVTVPAWTADPAAVAAGARPPDGVPAALLAGQPTTATAAPSLALAGALLLLGAGIAVLLREPRLARLGARYAAAGDRPRVDPDPDRAAWADLDEGRDPTVEGPPGAARDTGGGAPTGRGDDS
jgi:tryptophan-associated transmembrane protein